MAKDLGPYKLHSISMPALGRLFNLGDLYDYNNETILKDDRLSWEPAELVSATQVSHKFEKRFTLQNGFCVCNESLVKSTGFNQHLQTSFVVGFIRDALGATVNYINNGPDPTQATCTIICRAKITEKKLDLVSLVNYKLPHLVVDNEGEEQQRGHQRRKRPEEEAIHVVTSIFYGTEIYCVLSNSTDGIEVDQETRKEVEEQLSKFALQWRDALDRFETLNVFKKRFGHADNYFIAQINCQLYTDLQTQPNLKCGFFDSYKHSMELLEAIFTSTEESGNSKAIPVAIQICPLQILVNPWEVENKITYNDIDDRDANRCCKLFAEMKQIVAKAEKIHMTKAQSKYSCNSLKKFVSIVAKYQQMLQTRLRKRVASVRQIDRQYYYSASGSISKDLSRAEVHLLFKHSQLQNWLNFKEAEMDMLESIASKLVNGMHFSIDKPQLEQLLRENNKYSAVLFVPPLGRWTNSVLRFMKKCTDTKRMLFMVDGLDVKTNKLCSHTNQKNQKKVLKKVGDLASFVENNLLMSSQVNFIVAFDYTTTGFCCSYSVFQSDRLLKNKIRRLPGPPTGLRFYLPSATRTAKRAKAASPSSILVEWDYEDLGYPYQFVIQHRMKGSSDCWVQQRTTEPNQNHLSINSEPGTAVEIRIAVETCIGGSEFSQVVDTETAEEDVEEAQLFHKNHRNGLLPPIGLNVTSLSHNSALLQWSLPPGICRNISFLVDFWKEGEDYIQSKNARYGETSCTLEDLQTETTYLLKISTVSEDDGMKSDSSVVVSFKTEGRAVRFAETLSNRSDKIGRENGLDIYAVPLTELNGRLTKAEHFVFGEPTMKREGQKHRTILLVGSSISGKTPLINAMINYIFNVDWTDTFRFELFRERVYNDKSRVNVYDINHVDGFRIDYSLTIIDAPSYWDDEDPVGNEEITETIRQFFFGNNCIQEVDMVGFVMDSSMPFLLSTHLYIYCSLMTIFGNKVKDNINFLFNYADGHQDPPLLSCLSDTGLMTGQHQALHYKFDSSTVFISNSVPDCIEAKDFSWCMENLEKFFSSLSLTTTKSIPLSKQALEQKKRLESVVHGLIGRLNMELKKFQELQGTRDAIIIPSWNVNGTEVEIRVTVAKPKFVPFGEYATNCSVCRITCHDVCSVEKDKFDCDVMDHLMPEETRTCRVCECPWNVHSNELFQWGFTLEEQMTTVGAIKEKYETQLQKSLTRSKAIEAVNEDIGAKENILVHLLVKVLRSISLATEIAQKLNCYTKGQYTEVSKKVNEVVMHLMLAKYERIPFDHVSNSSWRSLLYSIEKLADDVKSGPLTAVDEKLLSDIERSYHLHVFNSRAEEEEAEDEDEDEGEMEEDGEDLESTESDQETTETEEESEESFISGLTCSSCGYDYLDSDEIDSDWYF